MNDQEQQRACAELDGFIIYHQPQTDIWICHRDNHHVTSCFLESVLVSLPNYGTSYDAIIPLIQKQPQGAFDFNFIAALNLAGVWSPALEINMRRLFDFQPAQLREALLRSTDRWID